MNTPRIPGAVVHTPHINAGSRKAAIDELYGINNTPTSRISSMTDYQVIQMVESQTWKSLNTEDRELLATRASEMSYFQLSENRGLLDKFVATLMLHRVIEADRQRDKQASAEYIDAHF